VLAASDCSCVAPGIGIGAITIDATSVHSCATGGIDMGTLMNP